MSSRQIKQAGMKACFPLLIDKTMIRSLITARYTGGNKKKSAFGISTGAEAIKTTGAFVWAKFVMMCLSNGLSMNNN
jgi:phosphate/sulfate permease